MKKLFEKSELKYILFSLIFAFIYFIFVMPELINRFSSNSPYIQFIIFTLGIYAFFFVFLKSFTTSTKTNLLTSLGLLLLFLSLDIFLPEYHVNSLGQLVQGGIAGTATTDYIFGLIAQQLGLTGILIYIFTYIFVPVVLLLVSAKILPNFIKHI